MTMKKMRLMMAVALMAIAAACDPCLAQERNTPEVSGDFASLVAGERIFAGNPVGVWTNGLAYSAAQTGMVVTVIGRAEATVPQGGRVVARRGTFRFPNLGITPALIGKPAFSAFDLDGWGVAGAAPAGGASIQIGVVADVDGDGVWVRMGK